MKSISILGSTGSIGRQTLEAAESIGGIHIRALCAHSGTDILYEQIINCQPDIVCVVNEEKGHELCKRINNKNIEFVFGEKGIEQIVSDTETDMVVNSIVGAAGLIPTVKAIESGKDIAFANKETLVCAGKLIMDLVNKHNVKLLPVDSEHSAIFQCLKGNEDNAINKIYLTASGGPFRNTPKEELEKVTLSQALAHPNWSMGRKITIDSATLMNKGLEVIEAKWLFGVNLDKIEVIVHPESVIHSMVEFEDGAVMAQLGAADMRLPIAYALTYPYRKALKFEKLDFNKLNGLHFEQPRYEDFPCLNLALEAIKAGGTMPALMNAANETAVNLFLNNEISFTQIPVIIERAMSAYNYISDYKLSDVIEADAFGRSQALKSV